MIHRTVAQFALLAASPLGRLISLVAIAAALGLGVFEPAEVIGGGVGG